MRGISKSTMRARWAVGFVLFGVAACDQRPTQPSRLHARSPDQQVDGKPAESTRLHGLQARYFELARRFPGFAGVSLDESNQVAYVYATTSAAGQAAVPSVHELFSHLRAQTPTRFHGHEPTIKVVPVAYDYVELARWRESVDSIAGEPGLTAWGISERDNSVLVQVRDQAASNRIARELATFGAPASAFRLTVAGPVTGTATLGSQWVKPFGGVRIWSATEGCTLGFNAYDSTHAHVFITGSHCTQSPYANDGGLFYQPTTTYPAIGYEVNDPTPRWCPFGSGRCRYADAATIRYVNDTAWKFSYLARLQSDTTVGAYEPITGRADSVMQGEDLARLGATTGMSRDRVYALGQYVQESGPNGTIIISETVQVQVTGIEAQGGDSGGPIFLDPLVFPSPGQATLVGLEFAIDSSHTYYYYSPLQNIEWDLGPLTVFGTTVTVTGPTRVTQTDTSYTWTAHALGGSGYSYQWERSTDGNTWNQVGLNTDTYSEMYKVISTIGTTFWLRCTVTSMGTGDGVTGRSDPFTVIVKSYF